MEPSLVDSRVLQSLEAEVRRRVAALTDIRSDILADQSCAGPLRNYLLFTHWPELVAERMPGLTRTLIWCNRYFWIRRLAVLWQREHGFDAGIDQFASKVLEQFELQGGDCAMIEAIEASARL